MPTTRSKYTFKQFQQVLNAIAHQIAIEAVINLKPARITIKTFESGELNEVDTGTIRIRFFLRHLSFSYEAYDHPDHFSFEIEEKFYGSSAHCSKISFFTPEIYIENRTYEFDIDEVDHAKTDAEKQRRQNKIDEFLEQLMKDADLKIEPRLSLKDCKK